MLVIILPYKALTSVVSKKKQVGSDHLNTLFIVCCNGPTVDFFFCMQMIFLEVCVLYICILYTVVYNIAFESYSFYM